MASKSGEVGGGAPPPPLANNMIRTIPLAANMVMTGCFSEHGWHEKAGGLGGRSPPPFANNMIRTTFLATNMVMT